MKFKWLPFIKTKYLKTRSMSRPTCTRGRHARKK